MCPMPMTARIRGTSEASSYQYGALTAIASRECANSISARFIRTSPGVKTALDKTSCDKISCHKKSCQVRGRNWRTAVLSHSLECLARQRRADTERALTRRAERRAGDDAARSVSSEMTFGSRRRRPRFGQPLGWLLVEIGLRLAVPTTHPQGHALGPRATS
jgi:hypothetical protein